MSCTFTSLEPPEFPSDVITTGTRLDSFPQSRFHPGRALPGAILDASLRKRARGVMEGTDAPFVPRGPLFGHEGGTCPVPPLTSPYPFQPFFHLAGARIIREQEERAGNVRHRGYRIPGLRMRVPAVEGTIDDLSLLPGIPPGECTRPDNLLSIGRVIIGLVRMSFS
ncbi:hypothetical protein NPIL_270791 [Nephila pilipes]|uniref:Uncharacterized protein n=1 Tax=Nephila pilipes TaxID=299642 RepID=A0A8X6KE59_NEPPI|nr:hypothetical protein NPIL_270791 [Nephila pilipes]